MKIDFSSEIDSAYPYLWERIQFILTTCYYRLYVLDRLRDGILQRDPDGEADFFSGHPFNRAVQKQIGFTS